MNKTLAEIKAKAGAATATLPLNEVSNILNAASSLLPTTSKDASSSKAKNNKKALGSPKKRGRKAYPRDANGKIIRPIASTDSNNVNNDNKEN